MDPALVDFGLGPRAPASHLCATGELPGRAGCSRVRADVRGGHSLPAVRPTAGPTRSRSGLVFASRRRRTSRSPRRRSRTRSSARSARRRRAMRRTTWPTSSALGAYMAGQGQPHRWRHRQRRHAHDPPARPGPGLSCRGSRAPQFCAVPSDTPIDQGAQRDPVRRALLRRVATRPQGVVLARNPNYHGSRPHHFARIELAVGIPARRAFAEIRPAPPTTRILGSDRTSTTAGLAARRATRRPVRARQRRGRARKAAVLRQPGPSSTISCLNTHRTLFADVRVRQAVNYAIDRRALARLATPRRCPCGRQTTTCRRGCPDTATHTSTHPPGRSQSARALAAHGGRPHRRALHLRRGPCRRAGADRQHRPRRDRTASADQGFPFVKYRSRGGARGEPFDLAWNGWEPDYPDPYAMLNSILETSCATRLSRLRPTSASSPPPHGSPAPSATYLRQARPRSRPQRRAAGRVREPTTTTSSPLASAARPTGSTEHRPRALCLRHPHT